MGRWKENSRDEVIRVVDVIRSKNNSPIIGLKPPYPAQYSCSVCTPSFAASSNLPSCDASSKPFVSLVIWGSLMGIWTVGGRREG